jgi:RNA polymerase sigma factor (sigma-70 family)
MATAQLGTLLRDIHTLAAARRVARRTDRQLLDDFAAGHDEPAFAALVSRHGPMVLRVCRRVLGHEQDAEDAFQATFLVLARNAGSIRKRESLASWLHGVAHRTAMKAKRGAARRRKHEGGQAAQAPRPASPTWDDVQAVLDEEVQRLPQCFREAFVLCVLEGKGGAEAAAELACKEGTVKSRVSRARRELRERLARRGIQLAALLAALSVAESAGRASVPAALAQAALQSGLLGAAGSPAAGTIPPHVAALAAGVTRAMFLKKAKIAAFLLLAAGLIAGGAGLLTLQALAGQGEKTAKAARLVEAAADAEANATVSGRVLGLDGKPVAGAELLLAGRKKTVEKLVKTDADGKFAVAAPRGERWVNLVARAPGAGIDFLDLGELKANDKAELRLVKDHAIRGRVIGTEGKPVAGVVVSVAHVGVYGNNTIDPLLKVWKNRHPMSGLPGGVKHVWDEGVFPTTTTDKDGRFVVAGAGGERLVSLRFRGVGIAEAEAWVVNRQGFDPKPYNKATRDNNAAMPFGSGSRWLLYGPAPSVVAEAEKPIRGVAKDRDTGKPRAGVRVTLSRNGGDLVDLPLSATTDAEGRYEIRGARKHAKGYMVEVPSDPANGYMASQARAADTPGYGPINLDVLTKKGAVIGGRVIDQSTGKGLRGLVFVAALVDNPFAKNYPEFDSASTFHMVETDRDGAFRIVTIPGPVILMGGPDSRFLPDREIARFRFKPPVPDPKYPQYFAKEAGFSGAYYTFGGGISPLQGNFAKVLEVKPDAVSVKHNIVLEPASALAVKILDREGQTVNGTWVAGISAQDWNAPVRLSKGSCDAYHLQPGKPRLVVVYDPAGKQFGTLRLKGDEKEPQEVKLGPGGAVKGRLVDEEGRPRAGVTVQLHHRERTAEEIHDHAHRSRAVETDSDGRFRIDEVVPGVKFFLRLRKGKQTLDPAAKLADASVAPGKLDDLGDIKVKLEPGKGEE